jgi:hypothetical protein
VPGENIRAKFIEPMLLLRTEKLPEGAGWLFCGLWHYVALKSVVPVVPD